MNKEEQDSKKDIAKRLEMSNKKLWDSLSYEEKNNIINEYYDSLDISHIGISGVLGNIRDTSRDLILIIMGLLLGFWGSLVNNIFAKYLPEGYFFDVLFVIFFICIIFFFFRETRKLNVEQIRSYKVLDHFVKLERKKQEEKLKDDSNSTLKK